VQKNYCKYVFAVYCRICNTTITGIEDVHSTEQEAVAGVSKVSKRTVARWKKK